MKRFWDPGIGRTILFSLAVVSFVIASYQTLATGNMEGLYHNYWLYMLSFGCMISYRYLKQRDKEATAAAEAAAKAAATPASGRKKAGTKKR